MRVCVCVHGMVNCNMIFFLFRIAEPWQQLSSKGCICGSVMGSQWCAGQAGSLFHRLRDGMCKAVAGAGSRRAWIMNSIFSACLLCPPLSTKLYLDIKRCHRPCSVTAGNDKGREYRRALQKWSGTSKRLLTKWYDKCFTIHLPNATCSDLCSYGRFLRLTR